MKIEEVKVYAQQAVDKIKSLGYDVYLYPENSYSTTCNIPIYGYVVTKDGKRFGYYQLEEPWYHAVRFSTCHKANSQCGTGFSCQDHWHAIPIDNITAEHIAESFIDPPAWASPKDKKAARENQWRNLEEFRTCKAYYGARVELIKQ